MAIKERKQITGTEAQIKGYAGHNGVLAYATDTKHLHVLSGTAGTTTKLANMSDIPSPVDISGKADKTYVDTELAKKQAKGDYATTKALTDGLAGKANKAHTHAIADVTNLQTTLNTINDKIPKTGNRGTTAGFSSAGTLSAKEITISETSPDVVYYGNGRVTLKALPSADDPSGVIRTWTKSVYMTGGTVNIGPTWFWVGGETPELAFPCVLVCHAIGHYGIVGVVKGAS